MRRAAARITDPRRGDFDPRGLFQVLGSAGRDAHALELTNGKIDGAGIIRGGEQQPTPIRRGRTRRPLLAVPVDKQPAHHLADGLRRVPRRRDGRPRRRRQHDHHRPAAEGRRLDRRPPHARDHHRQPGRPARRRRRSARSSCGSRCGRCAASPRPPPASRSCSSTAARSRSASGCPTRTPTPAPRSARSAPR